MTPWVPAHPHTLRPEPKVAGRRERQRGNTSPAEGKGKVAAGNIGGFIRIYISNVSSCPCRARTIRIHLTQGAAPRCFALPWAGFLLGLQPVHVPSVVLIVRVFINHIPRTSYTAHGEMHLEEHAPSFFYQYKSVKSVFIFFIVEDHVLGIRINLILRILPCGRC